MRIENKQIFCINLLQSVINKSMSSSEALELWPNIDEETDNILIDAWHTLSHFDADSDIREKDIEYKNIQIKNLLDEINNIKSKVIRN